MTWTRTLSTIVFLSAFACGFSSAHAVADEQTVDFNRDIRPIFASKCFACHGPDEGHREAGLRLDVRDAAIEFGAFEPLRAAESEMIRRITSSDPEEVMPPPHTGDFLTEDQKQLFARWVQQGAAYAEHWSFVPPMRPKLPTVKDADWPRNEIDNFVLARLEAEGLTPSPEADGYSLARRLFLDLIGLPPTPEEVDAFVHDSDPQAYEHLVERLLDSEHYGERWARQWLDLARYSDTNGYEKDRDRSIWPYRDWVIRALNADMPFDQFTIEQLAGDMLENPSQSQRIATGFHRNTMLNEEGGIDPLEYRFHAVVDRVATTGTIWMGLSTGCAQCHTHKYDPITHTDYYSLFALLNNADEPEMVVRTEELLQRRAALQQRIARMEEDLPKRFPIPERAEERNGNNDAAGRSSTEGSTKTEQDAEQDAELRRKHLESKFAEWTSSARGQSVAWQNLIPSHMETNLPRLQVLDDGSIFSSGDITKRDVFKLEFPLDESSLPITSIRLEVIPDERLPAGGPGRCYYEGRRGDFFLSEIDLRQSSGDVKIASATHSYGKISVGSGSADAVNVFDDDGSTGWATAGREGEPHQLVLNLETPITEPGTLQIEMLFERHFAASLGRFRFSATASDRKAQASEMPVDIEALLAESADNLSDPQREQLLRYYLTIAPELDEPRKEIESLRRELPDFPSTMVMEERSPDYPRPTFRHHRGEYLSPREVVAPAIPAFLRGGEIADSNQTGTNHRGPSNRLELARWLVSRQNPLVARVTVNRAWQAFFGKGLQRASDDFGTQADPPTHPKLLDWLATELIERGWSLKRLHYLIVTSATYRQDARVREDLLERDFENDLLARGPRFRVPAEMVRDILLRSSGLLSDKMYGPGVRPPQPASVTAVAYGSPQWNPSTGEDRYRRSLYTYNKRTAPFAAFTVFDAPTGENCIARRNRSNTPLQALTMLNDEMFLEMAQGLAKLAVQVAGAEQETATFIFRRLLSRPPSPTELTEIVDFYRAQLERIDAHELAADQLSGSEKSTNQQAAWTIVARALMNLDETITKP